MFNHEYKYSPNWTTRSILLPVNHNYNKFVIFTAFLKLKHKKFFESSEKEPFLKCACAMARTVRLLRRDGYCPITLSYQC